jgi:DNA polymerase-4
MLMPDKYNNEKPLIMHVDLNSAFASIEQQARPLLRGRPVAVLNRRTEHTVIVTASYEAKALGVKVGMKFTEAARLAPGLVAVESGPVKYRFVYRKLMAILNDYSSDVVMKSIDEGVIDFHNLPNPRPLVEIGHEIKQRLKDEIGVAMRCNVGIGPNRFLAKTAAGLHKPDGLDVINANNLRSVYKTMKLTDLIGIAGHLEKRLNAVGIYTPIEFLDASAVSLEKVAFKSIIGGQWHDRLRGYEVDGRPVITKTVGRQYVLEKRNLTRPEIIARLHHLCESVGSRLRAQNKVARGIYIYTKTDNHEYWHASQMCQLPFYSDRTINYLAQQLFLKAVSGIREIGIHCYELSDNYDMQMSLFNDELVREQHLVGSIDAINQRFGDRTVHAASTLNTGEFIKQKIPFGSTRYL